jgi:ribonuclease HII
MFRGIEMEDSSPPMANHEKAVEHSECCRRHREQVHGDRLAVILKKGRPEPAGISAAAHLAKVARDRALGNLEVQL